MHARDQFRQLRHNVACEGAHGLFLRGRFGLRKSRSLRSENLLQLVWQTIRVLLVQLVLLQVSHILRLRGYKRVLLLLDQSLMPAARLPLHAANVRRHAVAYA